MSHLLGRSPVPRPSERHSFHCLAKASFSTISAFAPSPHDLRRGPFLSSLLSLGQWCSGHINGPKDEVLPQLVMQLSMPLAGILIAWELVSGGSNSRRQGDRDNMGANQESLEIKSGGSLDQFPIDQVQVGTRQAMCFLMSIKFSLRRGSVSSNPLGVRSASTTPHALYPAPAHDTRRISLQNGKWDRTKSIKGGSLPRHCHFCF